MTNKIRPIDANALALKISEYMVDFPKRSERMFTCMHILSMLEDENQTPTLSGLARDTNVPSSFAADNNVGRNDKPFPLDTILGMEGERVLIRRLRSDEPPEVGTVQRNGDVLTDSGARAYIELYLETWGAFPYPPARIDREKWTACEYCHTCSTCKHDTGDWERDPCYDCGHYKNWELGVRFCPRCGRPLTPEAWEMLEKRLRG